MATTRKKTIGYCPPSSPVVGKVNINLNTIITTVLGAIVIYLITTALSNQKTNSKTLDKIEVTLPFIQSSVGEVKQTVTEMKATTITRSELDNKLARTDKAIEGVKDDIKDVRSEQKRLSDKAP